MSHSYLLALKSTNCVEVQPVVDTVTVFKVVILEVRVRCTHAARRVGRCKKLHGDFSNSDVGVCLQFFSPCKLIANLIPDLNYLASLYPRCCSLDSRLTSSGLTIPPTGPQLLPHFLRSQFLLQLRPPLLQDAKNITLPATPVHFNTTVPARQVHVYSRTQNTALMMTMKTLEDPGWVIIQRQHLVHIYISYVYNYC